MKLVEHTDRFKSRLRDLEPKTGTDPEQYIQDSVMLYSRYRKLVVPGSVALVAGQAQYAAVGLVKVMSTSWGRTFGNPWDASPGTPPTYMVDRVQGKIVFTPTPAAFDIATWGVDFAFMGAYLHTIIEASSTVPEEDDGIITLGALMLLLSDLANQAANKSGGSKASSGFGVPRDATLAGRANALMAQWELQMGVGSGVLQRLTTPVTGGRG